MNTHAADRKRGGVSLTVVLIAWLLMVMTLGVGCSASQTSVESVSPTATTNTPAGQPPAVPAAPNPTDPTADAEDAQPEFELRLATREEITAELEDVRELADAVTTALGNQEDGVAAALLALDKGYDQDQILTAATAGRLLANGDLQTGDGSTVAPSGPRIGLLIDDRTTTDAGNSSDDEGPRDQHGKVLLWDFTDAGNERPGLLLYGLFAGLRSGYTPEQILAHLFANGQFTLLTDIQDDTPVMVLLDEIGQPVKPAFAGPAWSNSSWSGVSQMIVEEVAGAAADDDDTAAQAIWNIEEVVAAALEGSAGSTDDGIPEPNEDTVAEAPAAVAPAPVSPAGTYELVEETALRGLSGGPTTDINLDSYARGSVTIDERGFVEGSIHLSYLSDTTTVVDTADGPETIVYTAVVSNTSTLAGTIPLGEGDDHFVFDGRLVVNLTWFNPHLEKQQSSSGTLDATGRLDAVEGLLELALLGDDGFVELRR